jgi:hypothetical protein
VFLDIQKEVLSLLDEVLSLDGRALAFDADTPLRFDIIVPDDEVDGSSFATVGSVVEFVTRLNAH